MDTLQKSILKTVVYADVFDYPLTFEQLKKFLITPQKRNFSLRDIEKGQIVHKGDYFFLKDRQKIVEIRQNKERYCQKKLRVAQKIAHLLKIVPFLKMVAVTGNLAMGNADQDDDIDFLVVTARGRLWLSRFLVVVLIEILGKRRHPKETQVKDKICLNMFLDEDHLKIPKKEQNLFSAHEILQLKPLWQKDNLYQKLLKQNQWVERFLGNWKN